MVFDRLPQGLAASCARALRPGTIRFFYLPPRATNDILVTDRGIKGKIFHGTPTD